MRHLVLPIAVLLPAVAAAQASPRLSGRLREVRVVTTDVFTPQFAAGRPLATLVNALHWTTREDVVRREVWFVPGDVVDGDGAAELERNLRALGLFADVSVRLVATGVPDEVDLEVVTHDRLTLSFGAGASYVGGVTGLSATVGEGNLLGLGDRLAASFRRNSDGEYRGGLVYTDLQVLDSWHTGTVRLGRTDEGDSIGIDVRRPFQHLLDPRAYGIGVGRDEADVDYYRGGDSVAAVRDLHTAANANLRWGSGPVDQRRSVGFVVEFDEHDYGPATGPLAPAIRVPGDTWSVFAGATGSWQSVHGYRKVEGLDTLVYIQDLTLGVDVGATLGARWRDEDGAGGELQPELRAHATWAAEPIANLFTNVGVRGSLREDGGEAVGWNTVLSARAFAMVAELHTLAANATFDAVEETQDLPVELTLGEDGGLRGYPTREFAGTRRLRGNLEHRFDTGIELATLHLGLVAFFDAGWVSDDGGLGRPVTSAGAGLRIGSRQLFGGSLLRIDFARPLDEVPGESDGWKFSVSVGQVFGFDI
ncbi:MAG: BamA/TamA family outer membrane protein [Planctomycetes bacterium]|nr:BamA/TamA family outer membrane protein [Planctomycetota bacterium]